MYFLILPSLAILVPFIPRFSSQNGLYSTVSSHLQSVLWIFMEFSARTGIDFLPCYFYCSRQGLCAQRRCLSVLVKPVSDLCELSQQCNSLAAGTLLSDRGNLWMRGVRMSPNYTNKGLFLHSSPCLKGKGCGTFSHIMASAE